MSFRNTYPADAVIKRLTHYRRYTGYGKNEKEIDRAGRIK